LNNSNFVPKLQMDEIVNITHFLTKQGIYKDMQIEILKYYQLVKKKYRVLILDYDELYHDNCKKEHYLYHEIIPYGPIDQIDLTNLYKFIHYKNNELANADIKAVNYDDKKITFISKNRRFRYTTKTILDGLIKNNAVLLSEGTLGIFELKNRIMIHIKTIEL